MHIRRTTASTVGASIMAPNVRVTLQAGNTVDTATVGAVTVSNVSPHTEIADFHFVINDRYSAIAHHDPI
jgi:hypothetical protein